MSTMLTHYHPQHHFPLPSSLNAELARLHTIIEAMKRRQPTRRACSAPSSVVTTANNTDAEGHRPNARKRARSAAAEPTRVSKRLRGLKADSDEVALPETGHGEGYEERVVPVTFSGKRTFARTSSAGTSTTVPDDDEERQQRDSLVSPLTPRFPPVTDTSGEILPSSIGESSSSSTAAESSSSSFAPFSSQSSAPTSSSRSSLDTSTSTSLRHSKRVASRTTKSKKNIPDDDVPPRVLIDGHPSLRIKFHDTIIYRQPSSPSSTTTTEWRSDYFLAHIPSYDIRLMIFESLQKEGYVTLPTSLFEDTTPNNTSPPDQIMRIFFDKNTSPERPLPQFTDFVNPETGLLDPARIVHWTQLSKFFGIPHNLDGIYHSPACQWHTTFHALPTFAGLVAFSRITEELGFKRARETIHQEMARRIRCLSRGGRARGKRVLLKMLKMGYEEMRAEGGKWIGREEEGDVWASCPGCRVLPGFV